MQTQSIRKNVIFNIAYHLLSIIFPLITFPYVSRILLVEGIGKVNFFLSLGNYLSTIAALGITTYGIRAIAKVRDKREEIDKIVKELLTVNMSMAIICVATLFLVYPWCTKLNDEPQLFVLCCVNIMTSSFGMEWLYSGLEQYEYITKRSFVFKVLSLIALFAFVHTKNDYIWYAAITIFATVGNNFCNAFFSRKIINYRKSCKLNIKRHIKPMLLLFAAILAVNIYTNLDSIMLSVISGDYEMGLYVTAVKIKGVLLVLINSISAVLLPRLSYYITEKKEGEYNRILRKSISFVMSISIPLTCFFIANASVSIFVLAGSDYLPSTICMQVIMPILIISGFSNITGNQILIPHGKEKFFTVALMVGAIIDLALNFILIPRYKAVGAAIATLFAELMQATIQIIFSYKYLKGNINWIEIIKVICATIISLLFSVAIVLNIGVGNSYMKLIVSSLIFGVLYVLFSFGLKIGSITENILFVVNKFWRK